MDTRREHAEEEEEAEEEEVANSGRRNGGNGGFRYFECLKNHAIGVNRGAVDGCGEFMPSGAEGTLEALICAACTCHRNFHRRVPEALVQPINPNHHHYHHHYHQQQAYYYHHEHHHNHNNNNNDPPSGHQGPLALVATSREDVQEEEISNHNHPSSSAGGSRKRVRTKFTPYQKDRMLVFSEGLGWRIQKEHEAAVEQFCAEIGINRQVLKVWMHNNKHTLGKNFV